MSKYNARITIWVQAKDDIWFACAQLLRGEKPHAVVKRNDGMYAVYRPAWAGCPDKFIENMKGKIDVETDFWGGVENG